MNLKAVGFTASLLSACLLSAPTRALEVNPGDYEQYPINSTIAVLYYQHGEGTDSYVDGKRVSTDTKLSSDVGIIRALHVYEIAPGVTVDPQFLLPLGGIRTGGALEGLGSPSGIGDLILTAPVKIKLDTKYSDVFSLTPYLIAPTGTYNSNQTINFGSNRWQGVFQTAYVKHFSPRWSLDLIGDVSIFSDNSSYRFGSLGTLKQDPLGELQAYLRYKITPTLEVSGGIGSRLGGQQSFDRVSLKNSTTTEYGRIAAFYFPRPLFQVQVELGREIGVNNGIKQDTFLQLRLARIFL